MAKQCYCPRQLQPHRHRLRTQVLSICRDGRELIHGANISPETLEDQVGFRRLVMAQSI